MRNLLMNGMNAENPKEEEQSERYVEAKVKIDRELYEALIGMMKSRSLSKIVNEALRDYISRIGVIQKESKKSAGSRIIMEYIREKARLEGEPLKIDDVAEELESEYGIPKMKTLEIIDKMLKEGLLYQPKPGRIMPT
jgi:DNA replicative helicase MCM subunit Mcm2 (Cdc46/Mcm family)